VIAAIAAAAVLWVIASSHAGWVAGGFASNGYGDLSPGKYGLVGCFLMEVVMTFFFLFIIIGTTSKGAAVGFAGIPIGLALTLIHLVSIPLTNTSVNPAQYRPGYLRRRRISRQALVILGRAYLGRGDRRAAVPLAARAHEPPDA
jgi:glycerol uptake facilitator-like aquaporin